jgi:hypothetical protein
MSFAVVSNQSTGFGIQALSDDVVVARGQYRNDQRTPIAIGGSTMTDGVSNNVWLDSDVYSVTPTALTTPKIEVEATGVGFNAAATVTGTPRILKQALLPTSRRGGNLIYDAKNKRFIMFGGYDGTTRYNEVWELTADSAYHRWTTLAPSGTPPTAKNLAASTYVRGTTSGAVDKAYMIVWGGATPADLNEMHSLDVSTPGSEAWTTITQTGAPSVRAYITQHMTAKSTGSNTTDIYLFGGWAASRVNDLYRCTFNVNTPTAVTWTTLKANGAVGSPSARSGTGLIYDSANDRLVVVGGYNGTTYLNDVWSYSISGNTFTQLSVGGSAPTGREMASLGYDVVNQRAIWTGGFQGTIATNRNDVIQLSLTSGTETWTTLRANDTTSHGILPFSNGSCAVDTARNIMVIGTMYGYDATIKYTYAFDMNDVSSTAPLYSLNIVDYYRARDVPGNVYNSASGELVLMNGYGVMDDDATITRGDHMSEVWAYNPTTNRWRYALGGPFGIPSAEGGMAVYDSTNDRIIYFGGLTGASRRSNDVWQLKADAHGLYKATRLYPTGTKPAPRWQMSGCYDAARNRFIFWGGQDNSTAYNDVWALDLTLGSEAWSQLSPTGTPPTAAWHAGYAYDSANKRLYVHGGATNQGGTTFTSQLFYLDVTTVNCAWTNTGVTGGIAARGMVLGYDATNQRLVCFSGWDGTVVNNTLRYTSTSSFTSWTTQAAPNAPAARRSAGGGMAGNTFIVTAGRPASGTWFSDTQALNATDAPGSWTWTNKNPAIFQLMSLAVSSLVLSTAYHWQSWVTNSSGNDSAVSSFGANSESATDFIVSNGTGGQIKVWNGSVFVAKPVKVWNGSTWVTKPLKRWTGSTWTQTPY